MVVEALNLTVLSGFVLGGVVGSVNSVKATLRED